MDETDRRELLGFMEEGRQRLLAVTRGLSDRQARFRPGEARWSILDCVEHLVLAERGLRYLATRASRPVPDGAEAATPDDEAVKRRQLDLRDVRVAPEPARPTGRFENLEAALQAFQETRRQTVEYVGGCADDLRRRVTDHPLAGTITAHQCLLLLALHPQRHCQQIEGIRRSDGFPQD